MNSPASSPYLEESPEVYYARERIVCAGAGDVAFLKERARRNPRLRARLCTHASPEDLLHEMLIVLHRDAYFRPHMHEGAGQSFVVVEGRMTVAILDDGGALRETLEAGGAGSPWYFRIPSGTWYSFIFHDEWGVFLETALGPFKARRTIWAPYSPDGSDDAAASEYTAALRRCTSDVGRSHES